MDELRQILEVAEIMEDTNMLDDLDNYVGIDYEMDFGCKTLNASLSLN